MRIIAIFLILLANFTSVYAAEIYKRIPFNQTLISGDRLIVNYDFSDKKGIRCEANNHSLIWVGFVYKGHQKLARLPIILQSDHVPTDVPNKIPEELADPAGQFSIFINNNQLVTPKQWVINCHYNEEN